MFNHLQMGQKVFTGKWCTSKEKLIKHLCFFFFFFAKYRIWIQTRMIMLQYMQNTRSTKWKSEHKSLQLVWHKISPLFDFTGSVQDNYSYLQFIHVTHSFRSKHRDSALKIKSRIFHKALKWRHKITFTHITISKTIHCQYTLYTYTTKSRYTGNTELITRHIQPHSQVLAH